MIIETVILKMVVLKIILLLSSVSFTLSEVEIKCTDAFCTQYREEKGCPELSESCRAMNATHHGTYLPYPDVCNCCEYCLTNIPEGEPCVTGQPGMPPPTEMCGPGLMCSTTEIGETCQPMLSVDSTKLLTKCSKAQQDWEKRRADGTLGKLEVRPKCDADGLYQPFHCIPGSICYCVSPEGDRIFGDLVFLNSWDENKMTCGCSINDWTARRTLKTGDDDGKNIVIPTARCTENGQFDPLQCTLGDKGNCTCVDATMGHPDPDAEIISVSEIREGHPYCFDKTRHRPGTYKTVCESMRDLSLNSVQSRANLFLNPNCQPDGMFDRVQILVPDRRNVCVDPTGNEIVHNGTRYGADAGTPDANDINCNCARNLWLLFQNGVTELPRCCNSGNFEGWQYRRSECYCVDENGDQQGMEVDAKNKENLDCYKNNAGDPCRKNNSPTDSSI